MSTLQVTLDGPAGVGKTTIAKRVAQELGVAYLDTGAMFRATAWKLGENVGELSEAELVEHLNAFTFTLQGSGDASVLLLNDTPLTDEIRTETVAAWASKIAALPVVREFQKKAQRSIGENISLTAEGRDMGTVVFPNAVHKFFLDADPQERARRRCKQLEGMGKPANLEELAEQIRTRDHQDRNRAVAPLKPADDAQILDTTTLNVDQVFEEIIRRVRA